MITLISFRNLKYFWKQVKLAIHQEYYNKGEIDDIIEIAISKVYRYKGSKQTYSQLLQVQSPVIGDVYNVVQADPVHDVNAGDNFAWDGTGWDNLRGIIDLSDYYTKEQTDDKIDDVLVDAEEKLREAKSYTDTLVNQEREKAEKDLKDATDLLNSAINSAKERLTTAEGLLADARTRLANAESNIGTLNVWKDSAQGKLNIFAEYINTNDARVTACELDIDAAEATIGLHTQNIDTLNNIISQAGIDINGIKSTLNLYANYLNPTTGEFKDAIIKIDGENATIQNYCSRIKGNEASIATLTINYNSIAGRVQSVETTSSGLVTRVGVLELTDRSFDTRLSTTEGNFSSISQTVNSINLTVGGLEQGSNYAAIVAKINADGTSEGIIKADRIMLLGQTIANEIISTTVTANNLKVKAANITGKLEASQIKVGDIDISGLDGKITANQIDSNSITADKIDATDLEVAAANITGTLNASQIDATNLHVSAANIDGEISATIIKSTDWQGGPTGTGTFYIGGNTIRFDSSAITVNQIKSSDWVGGADGSGSFYLGGTTAKFNIGHFGELYINGQKLIIGNNGTQSGAKSYFDENGVLHCNGAQIAGDFTANTIATSSNKFSVNANGILSATGANISGDFTANTIATNSGKFEVDSNGILHATNAILSGILNAIKLELNPLYSETGDSEFKAWFTFEKQNDILSPILNWKNSDGEYYLNMASLITRRGGGGYNPVHVFALNNNNVFTPVTLLEKDNVYYTSEEIIISSGVYYESVSEDEYPIKGVLINIQGSNKQYRTFYRGKTYKKVTITQGQYIPNNIFLLATQYEMKMFDTELGINDIPANTLLYKETNTILKTTILSALNNVDGRTGHIISSDNIDYYVNNGNTEFTVFNLSSGTTEFDRESLREIKEIIPSY